MFSLISSYGAAMVMMMRKIIYNPRERSSEPSVATGKAAVKVLLGSSVISYDNMNRGNVYLKIQAQFLRVDV